MQQQEICKICHRQISRYTCPECNIPYCSSTCFKSPLHADCSEPFYKKQIRESGDGDGQVQVYEERVKMMEILKRFEDEGGMEGADGVLDAASDDDDDDEDLVSRFQRIDVSSASPDTLWSLLTQDEKDRFIKASASLAPDLLHELDIPDPWWESLEATHEPVMHVPNSLVIPLPSGPPLIYNVLAVCHLPSLLPLLPTSSCEYQESIRILSALLPFLFQKKKSTTLYMSVSEAVESIWGKLDLDTKMSSSSTQLSMAPTSLFEMLMKDASAILRPKIVGVVSSPSLPPSPSIPPTKLSSAPSSTSPTSSVDIPSHPNRNLVYMLSDIKSLFTDHGRNTAHITHKLVFYAAHILSTPPLVLMSLAEDVLRKGGEGLGRGRGREMNTVQEDQLQGTRIADRERARGTTMTTTTKEKSRGKLIEELTSELSESRPA
ncbi:hypothetical protein D9757_009996 [Collybiopsis confluens]|uniref:HIT-type domain-containing protein n=1 Tax=Collybiopsis confluens TaxID=2823264 RepID=A0A8H5GUP4_9AGAR|nr:hypothetical protein D9757_009996 [Collybiopsis confluens]